MRLIDADAFKEQVAAIAIKNNLPADKCNALCELIEMQPTIEEKHWNKVVNRLEIKADVANDMMLIEGKGLFFDGYEEGLREAINEIHIQHRACTDQCVRETGEYE